MDAKLLLTEKSSVRLVPVVSLLFGSILWRGCVWSRWLWSIDSHSMLEFWRSDRDGLELMSDKAGDLEPWLMSLAKESLVLELPSGFLPSLGEVSPCCFRMFLRYFALAFWNHTYKRNNVFNDHFFGGIFFLHRVFYIACFVVKLWFLKWWSLVHQFVVGNVHL